jgi:hypothetical protein
MIGFNTPLDITRVSAMTKRQLPSCVHFWTTAYLTEATRIGIYDNTIARVIVVGKYTL